MIEAGGAAKGALRIRAAPLAQSSTLKGVRMNQDQVKGAAKEVAGKVQKNVGEAVGSTEQEAKGLAKEGEGKAQKEIGNAEEALKDAEDRKP
jgi:uncharacterized protein YjbJ (UPF0337 family)